MRLQYKISLSVFAVLLVIGAIGSVVMLRLNRQAIVSHFVESAETLGGSLQDSLEHDMLTGDRAHLQDAVNRIAAGANIKEVLILSNTGEVFASGNIAEVGQIRDEPEIVRVLASQETVTRSEDKYGRGEVGVVMPIMNKPGCYTCHGSSAAVLGAIEVGLDKAPLDAQLREHTWLMLLIGGLTFVALFGAIALVIRSTVVSPLFRLTVAAQRIAGGDFGARADVTGQDEVAVVSGTFNEMAERVAESVRRSQELSETILANMTDGVYITNVADYKITEVNRAFLEQVGLSRQEVIGKTCYQITHNRSEPCAFQGDICPINEAIITGQSVPAEHLHYRADGEPVYVEVATSLLKDEDGNFTQAVHLSRDITERKQAEEREKQLQQEIEHSSRLASIGELAAGVAHEINNPLTGIIGYSQLWLDKDIDEDIKSDLDKISQQARRAARVVGNLLTFARQRKLERELRDINEIVRSSLELRGYELKTGNIEVVTDLAADLPPIMLDFQQIEQVLLNIIINAEQAIRESGQGSKITIETGLVSGYIRISLSNDGPPIPAESMARLFTPFFTTRGDRGGTGLGLSVCHGIVEEHGGRIRARSRAGEDTVFTVELPLAAEVGDETKASEPLP